ncbi:hypothetical protein Poli38472_012201 [Pythium oligandrum]|uniref:Uncharacterized protein n=1 Tax=Pythium oligandrum TaxID=41045 RepID=A0A8K1CQX1_PYTOL|nr:hypothetical protein Poli38472_012201 [Pythium oligandrum]|eukprot:TMW67085.1 hypothetical protein Poli38472_012201 [Pythium oligandrum]
MAMEPSSSSGESLDEGASRGYRSTYYERKNEIATLQQEAGELTAQVKQLRSERGVVDTTSSLGHNALLRSGLQATGWAMAEAQSVISNRMEGVSPLETYIHLTSDTDQRRSALTALRDQKLRTATEFMAKRKRFLNLRRSHRQIESNEASNGDIVVEVCNVLPCFGVSSVKNVYEALLLANFHQEFAVWEHLNVLTVCQQEDAPDHSTSQACHLTVDICGMDLEKNSVLFQEYYDRSDVLERPHGLIAFDFVDKDDLYPYNPKERARLDVTGVMMVCGSGDEAEPCVSVIWWCQTRIHRPENGVSDEAMDTFREFVPRWADVSYKTVREYVAEGRRMTAQTAHAHVE